MRYFPIYSYVNTLYNPLGNLETSVTLGISRPFAVSPTYIPSLVPGEEVSCEVRPRYTSLAKSRRTVRL